MTVCIAHGHPESALGGRRISFVLSDIKKLKGGAG